MAVTQYLSTQIVNHIFRTSSWTKPSHLYVALFITMPDIEGSGGVEVSTSGTNYSREQCPPSDSNWEIVTEEYGQINVRNKVDIGFSAPLIDWGSIVGFGLYDAETSGNLLMAWKFSSAVDGSKTVIFSAGDILIRVYGTTDYVAERIATHLFRTGSWTKPAALYMAIIDSYEVNHGRIENVVEVSTDGTGYSRVSCIQDNSAWAFYDLDGYYALKNEVGIHFGTPLLDWKTTGFLAYGLYDEESSGNLLSLFSFSYYQSILQYDPRPGFAVGKLGCAVTYPYSWEYQ